MTASRMTAGSAAASSSVQGQEKLSQHLQDWLCLRWGWIPELRRACSSIIKPRRSPSVISRSSESVMARYSERGPSSASCSSPAAKDADASHLPTSRSQCRLPSRASGQNRSSGHGRTRVHEGLPDSKSPELRTISSPAKKSRLPVIGVRESCIASRPASGAAFLKSMINSTARPLPAARFPKAALLARVSPVPGKALRFPLRKRSKLTPVETQALRRERRRASRPRAEASIGRRYRSSSPSRSFLSRSDISASSAGNIVAMPSLAALS